MDRSVEFHGAKVAFFAEGQILTYRRDNRPDIPFPNMLDLPGGGREHGESGAECVSRETREEFGISVDPNKLQLVEIYENWRGIGKQALFYVGWLTSQQIEDIIFGDEGQGWKLMSIGDFLQSEEAVPHLQDRLRDYLDRTA